MSENQSTILISFMFFLTVPLIFFALTKKEDRHHFYQDKFFIYTGVAYLVSKFVPTLKAPFPAGIVWLIGLYFAAYAFTSQRYESRLDKIEFRYSTFTTQVAAGASFSNDRLMGILNEGIPVKPSIYSPNSIFKSFVYGPYSDSYYQTYNKKKKPFISAVAFRQQILKQWDKKLQEADFREAKLQEVDFRGAKLQGAYFMKAELQEADFRGAKLQRSDFRGAELQRANFSGAKLQGSDFRGAKFEKASFVDVELQGADFRNTKLQEAYFRKVKLQGANFKNAELQGANFMEAELQEADFKGAEFEKAKFAYAKLAGADFIYTELAGADFIHAELQGAKFGGAKLQGAYFWNAELQAANLQSTELQGADFREAELQGTNLMDSNLEGANFKNAKFLTAEQLIVANNIYEIKDCPPKVLEDIINQYGCEEMIKKKPNYWSDKFRQHRKNLLIKWRTKK